MPIYRPPEEKASQTITIRLTIRERRMLDHLAELDGLTLTDFVRSLISKRADERQITEPPPKTPKRRPGRPRMKRAADTAPTSQVADAPVDTAAMPSFYGAGTERLTADRSLDAPPDHQPHVDLERPDIASQEPVAEIAPPLPATGTVALLIDRFKETFVHRADGTKRELADAVAFFFSSKGGPPIISPTLPVSELSKERLRSVREAVKAADLRLAKKNLHLTYFRMMLHFAVKERDFDIRVNPSRDLEPLTITESNEGWRFFSGPSR